MIRWLRYPPPRVRWRDWRDNRRWKRMMKDLLYLQRYVEGDMVTEADGFAIDDAYRLRMFLQTEWGVREGPDG